MADFTKEQAISLINENLTQHNPEDRITGAELREVLIKLLDFFNLIVTKTDEEDGGNGQETIVEYLQNLSFFQKHFKVVKGDENQSGLAVILLSEEIASEIRRVVQNSTTVEFTKEDLDELYPDFKIGEQVICPEAGVLYEKTENGWVKILVEKLLDQLKLRLFYSSISSPNLDEINRENRIVITEIDKPNSRFKCNLANIDILKTKGTNNEPWFIAQGSEASIYAEVMGIEGKWIYYSTSWLGNININVGASVEFFNPFVNYQILNNRRPTLATADSTSNVFTGYPSTLNGKSFKYLMNCGFLKKQSDNKYRSFIGAVGSGETFVAEDNSINGSFSIVSQTPFFDSVVYPDGRVKGPETLMWGNVDVRENNLFANIGGSNEKKISYIGLLGVKDGNISDVYRANYCGFVFLDENGDIIAEPNTSGTPVLKIHEANMFKTYLSTISSWNGGWHITGMSFYKNRWHFIVKNWNYVKMEREAYHFITKENVDILSALESSDLSNINANILERCYLLHRGNDFSSQPKSIFYGQSDFNLFTYDGNLYLIFYFEPIEYGYVNSANRMAGFAIWNRKSQQWNYQNGLQLINPIQMFRKYSNLYWCFDHWGNLCCPYFENEEIYFATYLGTDDPDYFPAIIKLNKNGI